MKGEEQPMNRQDLINRLVARKLQSLRTTADRVKVACVPCLGTAVKKK
jgi:hypothetical protein